MIQFLEISELEYKTVKKLLSQLSKVNDLTKENLRNYLKNLPSNQHLIGLYYYNELVGLGSIFIEKKIIHKFSNCGHIEDIVIDSEFRGKGLGKKLINYLINYGRDNKCYKIILNCENKNIKFYEKNGFKKNQNQMSLYF